MKLNIITAFLYPLIVWIIFLLPIATLQADITLPCNTTYTVKRGDSLSKIAQYAYGDKTKFLNLYFANKTLLHNKPSNLFPGQTLIIPCLNTLPSSQDTLPPAIISPTVQKKQTTLPTNTYRLVTANHYPPFTGSSLHQKGLIVDLINHALKATKTQDRYSIDFVNDWEAHLSILLKNKLVDMSFPWSKPTCPSQHPRCEYRYSDPIYYVSLLLFTRKTNPIVYQKKSDLNNKVLCRPKRFQTQQFDSLIDNNKITLKQPNTLNDCFSLLLNKQVDAVISNPFTARQLIMQRNLGNKIIASPQSLKNMSLHVIVHKTHPKASLLINTINKGISRIKLSGRYNEIVNQHLAIYWGE